MEIQSLEICGFKSFKLKYRMESLKKYSIICGPCELSKTHLMQALYFVFGGSHQDLLNVKDLADVLSSSDHCYVMITIEIGGNDVEYGMEVDESTEADGILTLKRSIDRELQEDYVINDESLDAATYVSKLKSLNIDPDRFFGFNLFEQLFKSLQCSPKDLANLFENLCGSDKFADDYKEFEGKFEELRTKKAKLRKAKDKLKVYKWIQELEDLKFQFTLFKLYYMEQDVAELSKELEEIEATDENFKIIQKSWDEINENKLDLDQLIEDKKDFESIRNCAESVISLNEQLLAKMKPISVEEFIKNSEVPQIPDEVKIEFEAVQSRSPTLQKLLDDLELLELEYDKAEIEANLETEKRQTRMFEFQMQSYTFYQDLLTNLAADETDGKIGNANHQDDQELKELAKLSDQIFDDQFQQRLKELEESNKRAEKFLQNEAALVQYERKDSGVCPMDVNVHLETVRNAMVVTRTDVKDKYLKYLKENSFHGLAKVIVADKQSGAMGEDGAAKNPISNFVDFDVHCRDVMNNFKISQPFPENALLHFVGEAAPTTDHFVSGEASLQETFRNLFGRYLNDQFKLVYNEKSVSEAIQKGNKPFSNLLEAKLKDTKENIATLEESFNPLTEADRSDMHQSIERLTADIDVFIEKRNRESDQLYGELLRKAKVESVEKLRFGLAFDRCDEEDRRAFLQKNEDIRKEIENFNNCQTEDSEKIKAEIETELELVQSLKETSRLVEEELQTVSNRHTEHDTNLRKGFDALGLKRDESSDLLKKIDERIAQFGSKKDQLKLDLERKKKQMWQQLVDSDQLTDKIPLTCGTHDIIVSSQSQRLNEITVNYSSLPQELRNLSVDQMKLDEKQFEHKINVLVKRLQKYRLPTNKLNFEEAKLQLLANKHELETVNRSLSKLTDCLKGVARARNDRFEQIYNEQLFKTCSELFNEFYGSEFGQVYFNALDESAPFLGFLYETKEEAKQYASADKKQISEQKISALVLTFALHSMFKIPFVVLHNMDGQFTQNQMQLDGFLKKQSIHYQILHFTNRETIQMEPNVMVGVTTDDDECAKVFHLDIDDIALYNIAEIINEMHKP